MIGPLCLNTPSDDRVDHVRWEVVTIMRNSDTVAIVRSGASRWRPLRWCLKPHPFSVPPPPPKVIL